LVCFVLSFWMVMVGWKVWWRFVNEDGGIELIKVNKVKVVMRLWICYWIFIWFW
jgi:hypothetical protein